MARRVMPSRSTRCPLSSTKSGLNVASCPAGAGRPRSFAPVAFWIAAAENLFAFLAERNAGAVFFDLLQRAHMAQRLAGSREALQHRERLARGVHQLDLAARAALERLARRDPQGMHRLA